MRLIKRYPNRKLYDTEDKKYVTLNEIARLIRLGHEVQVLDHLSGEDLTAITLTQIISEQEKRQAGFLPRPVLRGLVQAGGERMSTLRRALASPLGLYNQVDQEIEARLRALVRRGELGEAERLRLREKLLLTGETEAPAPVETWEGEVERVLAQLGFASRSEVQAIEGQLDGLLQKVDSMLQERVTEP